MLTSLVQPIVGKTPEPLDADQLTLLVELLALNFHEHIELKPLFERAEDLIYKSTAAERTRRLKSLRSVARRWRGFACRPRRMARTAWSSNSPVESRKGSTCRQPVASWLSASAASAWPRQHRSW